MPLASASSSVNRMPSPTIVPQFGVLPDIMPVASTGCIHGFERCDVQKSESRPLIHR